MVRFSTAKTSFDSGGHDHGRCVDSALSAADALCRHRGARLTPLRRRVLEIVWTGHAPLGAYDILETLAAEQGRVAPPTVYRALEFLVSHGLVHRIESLNAYIGCARPDDRHDGQFLICRLCGATAELHDPQIATALSRSAREAGFRIEQETVELRGLCPGCRAQGTDASLSASKEDKPA